MPQEVYEKFSHLHHYTSFQGLDGILRSQQLWSTRHDCLNDQKEFIFANEFIPNMLEHCVQNVMNDYSDEYAFPKGLAADEAKRLYKSLYDTLVKLTDGFYVSCFSYMDDFTEDNGALTMWRAYSDYGQGYAIEFSTEGLLSLLQKQKGTQFSYKGYISEQASRF